MLSVTSVELNLSFCVVILVFAFSLGFLVSSFLLSFFIFETQKKKEERADGVLFFAHPFLNRRKNPKTQKEKEDKKNPFFHTPT